MSVCNPAGVLVNIAWEGASRDNYSLFYAVGNREFIVFTGGKYHIDLFYFQGS